MAAGSLLALLDDITTILDDVSVMTKIAAKKTAGVLGDDLALNAQQVTGVTADRELPVVWAVAKGSFINKLILVPFALAISYYIPWLITPLLMAGGAFLCFEGFEKIAHRYLQRDQAETTHEQALHEVIKDEKIDLLSLEKDKIKGAIRTDFILSAEIIVIALGTVAQAAFIQQVTVVSSVAILMTIGVYGLVAGIVKLDDLGLHLLLKQANTMWGQCQRYVGKQLLAFAPILMRCLSVLGTIAMFLVGGSIISHGLPVIHHFIHQIVLNIQNITPPIPFIDSFTTIMLEGLLGLIVGALCVYFMQLMHKIR